MHSSSIYMYELQALSSTFSWRLFLSLFLKQSVADVSHFLGCFWALQLPQFFWDPASHEVDRTRAPYLAFAVFSQLIVPSFFLPPPFFFPDYRLSGSARIPFLTHQNGDIHLKDDICGEFLNNLIVIRHRRGRGGGYDGGE